MELWTPEHELAGEVDAAVLLDLLAMHVRMASLAATLTTAAPRAIAGASGLRLALQKLTPTPPLRKPPAPISAEQRAARRTQRRARRRKTMTQLLVILAVLLVGCSAASEAYRAIPAQGQSEQTVAADTNACEAKAKAYKAEHSTGAVIGGGWLGMATNHNAYQREYVQCMTARGYRFEE